jgi:hypothetical protein
MARWLQQKAVWAQQKNADGNAHSMKTHFHLEI